MKTIVSCIVESVIVVVVAGGVGLAWNHYSENGLDLNRNYFKKLTPIQLTQGQLNQGQLNQGPRTAVTPGSGAPTSQPDPQLQDNGSDPTDPNSSQATAGDPEDPNAITGDDENIDPFHGVNTMELEDVAMYFEMKGVAAFLDARSRDHYEDGHIPGAFYLNHYQSQRLIEDIRSDLEAADILIVYCGGGDCEDSILLATSLISEYGFMFENVFVYIGGMDEWTANGHPSVEGAERGE